MKKKFAAATIAAASSLALVACSGGTATPGSTAGGTGTKTVTIGTLPIMPTAVIYMGQEKGYFAENGLDVKVETGQGGAALVPAVVSGSMQFGTSNAVSLLTARDKGLDVRVIASYTYDTPEGVHAVLVKDGSGINSAKDLAGKTVAINTLKSMGDLHIMDAVEKNGGDPSAIKFVEMGFPQMEAALAGGQVDAVWTPEPFMTVIKDAGYKVLMYDGVESVTGHPTMMFFTSGNLVTSDPTTVENMKKAINKSMDYAQTHPEEVRKVASEKLKIDQALADKVVLEDVGGPVRRDVVQKTGDLMTKYQFLQKPADVDGLLQSAGQ